MGIDNVMESTAPSENLNMNRIKIFLYVWVLCATTVQAQLIVTVPATKIEGQKALVLLQMKNEFSQKIESARASVFLLDKKGKMVGQSTKWVIGGTKGRPSLEPGATNSLFFVITSDKPLGTNLTANVNFNRVVLEGGKLADPTKDVVISNGQ
jgi:hypothetical protein